MKVSQKNFVSFSKVNRAPTLSQSAGRPVGGKLKLTVVQGFEPLA